MFRIGGAALALGALLFCGASALAAGARISETGSTLLYPLLNLWVAAYTQSHNGVEITTQASGSGEGIAAAASGSVTFGASDAYMSDEELKKSFLLNIPLAVSAQQINYNVPGLNDAHLNLSGEVLAGIYSGTILSWDDPAIRAMNPALAARLPHHEIIPIRRSDRSGDTFLFTQYLSQSSAVWKRGPGFGKTIAWPAISSELSANFNAGMVQSCATVQYSLAYVGISFLNRANAAHLGYAALRDAHGDFVLPSPANIAAAVRSAMRAAPKDGRVSLIDAPGPNAYPITNFEYAIVKPSIAGPDTRDALKAFLSWAIDPRGGNAPEYLDGVHFLPLPQNVRALSGRQIASIR